MKNTVEYVTKNTVVVVVVSIKWLLIVQLSFRSLQTENGKTFLTQEL